MLLLDAEATLIQVFIVFPLASDWVLCFTLISLGVIRTIGSPSWSRETLGTTQILHCWRICQGAQESPKNCLIFDLRVLQQHMRFWSALVPGGDEHC
ncbi:hypothetical protein Bca101_080189 [Brassica carinata]